MLFYILMLIGVFIGLLIVYAVSSVVSPLVAKWRHHQNKEWMRMAIDQEEYQNALYEEVLCEKIDDIANKKIKQMHRYRRK